MGSKGLRVLAADNIHLFFYIRPGLPSREK